MTGSRVSGEAMRSIVLLLALGCSSDDGGGGADAGSGASPLGHGGAPAAGTGGTPSNTGGAAAPTAGTGGTPSNTAGAAAPTAGTGGTPSNTGGAGAPDAGEGAPTMCEEAGTFGGPQLRDCDLPGACGRCMWEKACASFLFRCAKNADCVCMAECVASGGVSGTQTCFDQCGLTESPPGFAEWVKGASDMCWDEGCGTLVEPISEPGASTGASTGAGTDPDCAFDDSLSHDPCGSVLQLQSADGSLCARIERRNDGPGSDANLTWTLIDVRIGPLGQVCHVDDPTELCWFSSHHNYADWAHVSCGELHYDLNIGKNCGELTNPSSTYRLHVFENGPAGGECAPTADGSCAVVAPLDLFPME